MKGVLRLFGWPLLAAVVSLAGLVIGLLGDGPADLLAWIGVGLPLVMIGWAWMRRG